MKRLLPLAALALSQLASPTQAQRPTNTAHADKILLPNGWSLTPAGSALALGDLPLNMQLAPSGKLLAVSNNGQGKQSIQLIDPATEQTLDERPIGKAWYGLAFSAKGDKLYASGGNDNIILAYPTAGRKLGAPDTLRLGPAWPKAKISPVGVAVAGASQRLYTVTQVSQVAFTLQNQIEMKVRNNRDTTGTDPYKKVSLADGIDLSIAYNFGSGKRDARGRPVDSLKLSNLNLGYRVQVAKKLNVVVSSAFSFYQRDSTGRLLNRYLFENNKGFRLARLLNANLSLGYQFNPAARPKSKANIPRAVAPSNDPTLGAPLPQQIYADYIDFDIPWEATVQYTASYSTASAPIRPTLYGFVPILSGNSITASGSVKLTPNFRLSTSLNYDLVNNTFVYPTVNFYRDLHCWQISGLWIPVGPYRGYNFTIAAKSSLLQDLKLNRNKTILNR
jgi:hypothetical protein